MGFKSLVGHARRLLPLLAVISMVACAGPWGERSAERSCTPEFPYQDGWLGGDAAYSVEMPDGRTLWLFGDTFVAAKEQDDRQGAVMIHNTIGLSRCGRLRGWEIEYAWAEGADGTPHAFLERHDAEGWWWLFDGFVHEGRLYVGLLEVEEAKASGPLSMPFGFTGVQLARIRNPEDPMSEWQSEVVSLSPADDALPASALVVDGAHLYLFTAINRGDGRFPRMLTRLPLTALDGVTRDVGPSLQYLARDGSWKTGMAIDDARVLMADTATEMSVRFHPGLGKWLALYNFPDVGEGFPEEAPSAAVWIRSAENIEGPWSERRLLFRVPELASPGPSGDPNTGCYAAKEHPQFGTDDTLSVTYVCNLFTGRGQEPFDILQRLMLNMDLYRPIPVSIEIPEDL